MRAAAAKRKLRRALKQMREVRPHMKLPDGLVGRFLWVWHMGLRAAKARHYASGTEITADLYDARAERYSIRHRWRFDQIAGVQWEGRMVPLKEWEAVHARREAP